MNNDEPGKVVIAGAGPAGLTAAYDLCRRGATPIVLEQDPVVGGIARTEQFQGYRFDIGGHRFFTKLPEISRIWDEVLGDKFLRVPRLSRIYYNGRFFHYPLKLGNVIRGLGVWNSFLIFLSFLHALLAPYPKRKTSRSGSATALENDSTGHFSRPIPKKSGGCRARASGPNGRRSASRACPCARRSKTRSSATATARSNR